MTGLGGWVVGMRNNMINTLGEDYVTFAQANGLPERRIALRYAARNAILPNLTAFGLALGGSSSAARSWSRSSTATRASATCSTPPSSTRTTR